MIEMKNKICNRKTDKAAKKNVENQTNQNNSKINLVCTSPKFVNFLSIID